MLVKDAGEFELIARLAEVLEAEPAGADAGSPGLRLGIGDDAAAWETAAGTTVLTTDTMVEGVHFTTETTGWRDLGWKAIAVNLSDAAAMGAEPHYAVVTLGLTGSERVDDVTDMYEGIREVSQAFGVRVVGGDVVRAPVLFVTAALVGAARAGPGAPLLTRSAAQQGDCIAVTGHLGCSAGGLAVLTGAPTARPGAHAHLLETHRRPQPRVDEAAALIEHGVKAAMDVSDGLVADLARLCAASRVAATVRSDRLPIDDHLASAFPDRCLSLALEGGEDYELLFTAPSDVIERVAQSIDVPVAVIGQVLDGPPGVEVTDALGRPVEVSGGGWDHFGAGRGG